ncbi:hypothetical protein [Pelosinus sp. IPA-1]|uniref:hypothetical protein n=1 Tax=Pelosinus sp. IPA-1 TaxID=3029569 RepID=UPI0024361687|nr:hypothetical protein [Pelosinus sp. IPA-1]GMB01856.1 hypothetical protein PIPA1_46560 [Pelosinus sp. IPA-1]
MSLKSRISKLEISIIGNSIICTMKDGTKKKIRSRDLLTAFGDEMSHNDTELLKTVLNTELSSESGQMIRLTQIMRECRELYKGDTK